MAKNNPKWGTEEWIRAYPWSQMDKDRRRRVRNLLALPDDVKTLPHATRDVVATMAKTLEHHGYNADNANHMDFAINIVDSFLSAALDGIIAAKLRRAWKIEKPKCACGKGCSCKCHA